MDFWCPKPQRNYDIRHFKRHLFSFSIPCQTQRTIHASPGCNGDGRRSLSSTYTGQSQRFRRWHETPRLCLLKLSIRRSDTVGHARRLDPPSCMRCHQLINKLGSSGLSYWPSGHSVYCRTNRERFGSFSHIKSTDSIFTTTRLTTKTFNHPFLGLSTCTSNPQL